MPMSVLRRPRARFHGICGSVITLAAPQPTLRFFMARLFGNGTDPPAARCLVPRSSLSSPKTQLSARWSPILGQLSVQRGSVRHLHDCVSR